MVKKIAIWTGVALGSLLVLGMGALLILPSFFQKDIEKEVKNWANQNLQARVEFSGTDLSFFSRFPNLTLSINDVKISGKDKFDKVNLVKAKTIIFGIDVMSLFSDKTVIDQVELDQADLNLLVAKDGAANYMIFGSEEDSTATDTAAASLKIRKITIVNSILNYADSTLPFSLSAKGFSYKGQGNLSKDIFDLISKMDVKSMTLNYDGSEYLQNKSITADLQTKMNLKTLGFKFERNDLKINQLPVKFTGYFEFIDKGYDMSFNINSELVPFRSLFTALPKEYLTWMEETKIEGKAQLQVSLNGKYIYEQNIAPDVKVELDVYEGFIQYANAPMPLSDLEVRFKTLLPNLNPDSLQVQLDSFSFKMKDSYFKSQVLLKGIEEPYIKMYAKGYLGLDELWKTLGLSGYVVKGKYDIDLSVDGSYREKIVKSGLRNNKVDTVIAEIPKFNISTHLHNGYFKIDKYEKGIEELFFEFEGDNRTGKPVDTRLQVNRMEAKLKDNFINAKCLLTGITPLNVSADINTHFDLADLYKAFPIDSYSVAGVLDINVRAKGIYDSEKDIFPSGFAEVKYKKGSFSSVKYPGKIENIDLFVFASSKNGKPETTNIKIDPLSFSFEGSPFAIRADLSNLDDLSYSVYSNGKLNLGRLYALFTGKANELEGTIETNFRLKGKQSDAEAMQFDKISNSGNLRIQDITWRSDLYPYPFFIKSGLFTFNNDKISIDKVKMSYLNSEMILNGKINDVIPYLLSDTGKLKVQAELTSAKVIVDEFMAFNASAPSSDAPPSTSAGVVMLPRNLDLKFQTKVGKVLYQDLALDSVAGELAVSDGVLYLKELAFNTLGASVGMDATYTEINPVSAYFDYHLITKDFNIERAYKEVKMVQELASSLESAKGLISIDYKIKGKLDGNMMPVYKSLSGGGVLNMKDVKFSGIKVLGDVSKKTQKEGIDKPRLKGIEIKSTIENNVIEIEPFKFKTAGVRIKVAGRTTIDGIMDMKIRIGLPPMGIFGIPVMVKGSAGDPKIKFGKGGKDDENPVEDDYSDELPADILERIKKAKEEDDDPADS